MSPIFIPYSQSETEIKNGKTYRVSTRYQCITAFGYHRKKSFEELRLEDYRTCKWGLRDFTTPYLVTRHSAVYDYYTYTRDIVELLHSITCMKEYAQTSFEELRLLDYKRGKGPKQHKLVFGFGFGATSTPGTSGNVFGATQTNIGLFGQQNASMVGGTGGGLFGGATYSAVPFRTTFIRGDGMFQSITSMHKYEHLSFEELRLLDYNRGKGPKQHKLVFGKVFQPNSLVPNQIDFNKFWNNPNTTPPTANRLAPDKQQEIIQPNYEYNKRCKINDAKSSPIRQPFKFNTDALNKSPNTAIVAQNTNDNKPFKFNTDALNKSQNTNEPFKFHGHALNKSTNTKEPFTFSRLARKQTRNINELFKFNTDAFKKSLDAAVLAQNTDEPLTFNTAPLNKSLETAVLSQNTNEPLTFHGHAFNKSTNTKEPFTFSRLARKQTGNINELFKFNTDAFKKSLDTAVLAQNTDEPLTFHGHDLNKSPNTNEPFTFSRLARKQTPNINELFRFNTDAFNKSLDTAVLAQNTKLGNNNDDTNTSSNNYVSICNGEKKVNKAKENHGDVDIVLVDNETVLQSLTDNFTSGLEKGDCSSRGEVKGNITNEFKDKLALEREVNDSINIGGLLGINQEHKVSSYTKSIGENICHNVTVMSQPSTGNNEDKLKNIDNDSGNKTSVITLNINVTDGSSLNDFNNRKTECKDIKTAGECSSITDTIDFLQCENNSQRGTLVNDTAIQEKNNTNQEFNTNDANNLADNKPVVVDLSLDAGGRSTASEVDIQFNDGNISEVSDDLPINKGGNLLKDKDIFRTSLDDGVALNKETTNLELEQELSQLLPEHNDQNNTAKPNASSATATSSTPTSHSVSSSVDPDLIRLLQKRNLLHPNKQYSGATPKFSSISKPNASAFFKSSTINSTTTTSLTAFPSVSNSKELGIPSTSSSNSKALPSNFGVDIINYGASTSKQCTNIESISSQGDIVPTVKDLSVGDETDLVETVSELEKATMALAIINLPASMSIDELNAVDRSDDGSANQSSVNQSIDQESNSQQKLSRDANAETVSVVSAFKGSSLPSLFKGKGLLKKSLTTKCSVSSNTNCLEFNKPSLDYFVISPPTEPTNGSASGPKVSPISTTQTSSTSSSSTAVKNLFYLKSKEVLPIKTVAPFKQFTFANTKPAFDFAKASTVSDIFSFNPTDSRTDSSTSATLPTVNMLGNDISNFAALNTATNLNLNQTKTTKQDNELRASETELSVRIHETQIHCLVLHREKMRYNNLVITDGKVDNIGIPRNLYFFSAVPVVLNQMFTLEVQEIFDKRNTDISIGFTATNPSGINVLELPDNPMLLMDRQEYWAFKTFKFSKEIHKNDEIRFILRSNGAMRFYKHRIPTEYIVDTTVSLWLFVHVKCGIKKFSLTTNEEYLSVHHAMNEPHVDIINPNDISRNDTRAVVDLPFGSFNLNKANASTTEKQNTTTTIKPDTFSFLNLNNGNAGTKQNATPAIKSDTFGFLNLNKAIASTTENTTPTIKPDTFGCLNLNKAIASNTENTTPAIKPDTFGFLNLNNAATNQNTTPAIKPDTFGFLNLNNAATNKNTTPAIKPHTFGFLNSNNAATNQNTTPAIKTDTFGFLNSNNAATNQNTTPAIKPHTFGFLNLNNAATDKNTTPAIKPHTFGFLNSNNAATNQNTTPAIKPDTFGFLNSNNAATNQNTTPAIKPDIFGFLNLNKANAAPDTRFGLLNEVSAATNQIQNTTPPVRPDTRFGFLNEVNTATNQIQNTTSAVELDTRSSFLNLNNPNTATNLNLNQTKATKKDSELWASETELSVKIHETPMHGLVLHREKMRYNNLLYCITDGNVDNIGLPRNLYFFSAIPVILNQMFTLEVQEIFDGTIGNYITIGFTATDPFGINVVELPENPMLLMNRQEYWAFNTFKFSKDIHKDDEIRFILRSNGAMRFYKHRIPTEYFVDTTVTLWLFIQVQFGIKKFSITTNEKTYLSVHQAMNEPPEDMLTRAVVNLPQSGVTSNSRTQGLWDFQNTPADLRNTMTRNVDNIINLYQREPGFPHRSVNPLRASEQRQLDSFMSNRAPDIQFGASEQQQNYIDSDKYNRAHRLSSHPTEFREQPNSVIDNINSAIRTPFSNVTDPDLGVSQSNQSGNVNQSNLPVISKSKRQERENECIICFDKDIDCVLYKCGHSCMCMECSVTIQRQGDSKCPICRNIICDVIKFYKS